MKTKISKTINGNSLHNNHIFQITTSFFNIIFKILFMKLKNRLIYVLLMIVSSLSSFAQNPLRKVVFTLNENESIVSNEYYLMQQFNKNRFACMVYDNVRKKSTFILNGKRIKTGNFPPDYTYNICQLHSFNVANDSNYIITFEQNDKLYINYNGIIDGGFEKIELPSKFWNFIISEKNFDYLYKLADRWYVHKNGKNKKVDFIESQYKDGKYYVFYNGNSFGPFQGTSQLQLTQSGKYGFVYYNDWYKDWHVNNNGIISKTYENISNFIILEDGKWAYIFKENGKWFVNINGSISKFYDDVKNLNFSADGKWAYSFKEYGKWYINENGSFSKAYDDVIDLIILQNGKLAYCFIEDQKTRVNINGSISKGYEMVSDLEVSEDGKWSYQFKENGNWFINNNGIINNGFSSINTDNNGNLIFWGDPGELEISSANKEHSFYSSYKYEYVVIDGRPIGKSPAIQSWYDEKKNTFIWTAIEGKELLTYEYKLD